MSQSNFMDFNAIFFARARAYISEAAALLVALLFAVQPVSAAQPTLAEASTAMQSSDLRSKYAGLEAIKAYRSPEAADVLAQAALREKDVTFRIALLDQINVLGYPRVVKTISPILRDRNVQVRKRVARAIGMLSGSEAEAALVEALRRERDSDVQAALLQGLSLCGSDTSVEAIEAAMRNAPRHVRSNGVGALQRIRGPRSTAALEKAQLDKDPVVGKLAGEALRKRSKTK